MINRAGNSSALCIVILCLAGVPLSCSQGTTIAGSFVGPTEGSQSFVAIVTNGDTVMGYVCDGETTAEWFTGTATRDSIDLTSAGSIGLVAERGTGDTLDGTVTAGDGTESSFSAVRVDVDGTVGGLCRGILQVDGVTYTGGWIVLPALETPARRTVDPFVVDVELRVSHVQTGCGRHDGLPFWNGETR